MKNSIVVTLVLLCVLPSASYAKYKIIPIKNNYLKVLSDVNGNGIAEIVEINDTKKSGSLYDTSITIREKGDILYTKSFVTAGLWYAKICKLPYGARKITSHRDMLLLVDGSGILYILSWHRHGYKEGVFRLVDEKIQVFHPYD